MPKYSGPYTARIAKRMNAALLKRLDRERAARDSVPRRWATTDDVEGLGPGRRFGGSRCDPAICVATGAVPVIRGRVDGEFFLELTDEATALPPGLTERIDDIETEVVRDGPEMKRDEVTPTRGR